MDWHGYRYNKKIQRYKPMYTALVQMERGQTKAGCDIT